MIDKDHASGLLAMGSTPMSWSWPPTRCRVRRLRHPEQPRSRGAHPDADGAWREFAAGSMRPKVEAACEFAAAGKLAAIGALVDIEDGGGQRRDDRDLDADGIEFG